MGIKSTKSIIFVTINNLSSKAPMKYSYTKHDQSDKSTVQNAKVQIVLLR